MNHTIQKTTNDFKVLGSYTKEQKRTIIKGLNLLLKELNINIWCALCIKLLNILRANEKLFNSSEQLLIFNYLKEQRPTDKINVSFTQYPHYIDDLSDSFWWVGTTSLKWNKRTMVQKTEFIQHIINKLS